jgi:hypothetical protein
MALTHLLHHTTIRANLSALVIMVAFHVYQGPAFLTKEGKNFKTSLDGFLLLSSSVRNVSSYTTWVGKLDCVASSYIPPLVMSITFSTRIKEVEQTRGRECKLFRDYIDT